MDFQYEQYKEQMEQTDDGKLFVLEHTNRVTSSTISKMEGFLATLKEENTYNPGINPELEGEIREAIGTILDQISIARIELSAISQMGIEREVDGFHSVEDELSAIVSDTEKATNAILDCVDEIIGAVEKQEAPGGEDMSVSDYIMSKAIDITLNCSFQDITGQRVQKVVEVIQLIDKKFGSIEKKLGESPVKQSKAAVNLDDLSRESQKEAGLLNGPALPNADSISQAAIDDLFG